MKDQIIALINSGVIDSFRYVEDTGEIITVRENEATRFRSGKGNFSRSERPSVWLPSEWMISYLPKVFVRNGFTLKFV